MHLRASRSFLKLPIAAGAALLASGLLVPALVGSFSHQTPLSHVIQAATSNRLDVTSPIVVSQSPRITLTRGIVLLGPNAPEGARRTVQPADELANGRARLVIRDAAFTIEGGDGTNSASPEANADELAPLLKALLSGRYQSLKIERASVVRQPAAGDADVLGMISAELEIVSKSSIELMGALEANGETLSFVAACANPALRKKESPIACSGSISGALLQAKWQGRIGRSSGVMLAADRAEFQTVSLKRLAHWLGVEASSTPGFEVFQAKGRVEWTGKELSFEDAKFNIDGNAAEGSLSFSMSGPRPSVDGTLAFAAFELKPYASWQGAVSAAASMSFWSADYWAAVGAGGNRPLARLVDADIRASAASVTMDGAMLGRAAATVSVNNGRLDVGLTDVALAAGGEGEAHVTADLTMPAPHYLVRGELRGIETSSVLSALTRGPAASGLGSVSIDVASSGRSASELEESLAGDISIVIPGNGALGIDVPALFAAAREQASRPATPGWQKGIFKPSPVQAAKIEFSAKAGVFTTKAVEAIIGGSRYVAAGTLDVSRQILDIEVARIVSQGAERSSAETAIPQAIRLRGPWAAPEVMPAGPSKRS